MSDVRLPHRPMVELPPPVDGLDLVRTVAGRRRSRRAGLAAASVTTAAGVAVVVALSGGAAGVDVLKPAPPAGHGIVSPAPTATAPAAVGPSPITPHHRTTGRQITVAGRWSAPGHGGSGPATGGGQPGTGVTPAPGGRTAPAPAPSLTRSQSTYTGGPRECTGSTYGGPDGTFESAVGWCAAVTTTPVSQGVRLRFQLCRDSTGGGSLSFSGSREVDLTVRQGGKTIWDWAARHPGGPDTHRLSAKANGCWNWSLVWPDVTQTGASAGHGTFTFAATSTANEMKGAPQYATTFRY
jgi:hypothetical protein